MSSVLAQPSANSILTSLRGQSIVLPDLNAILDGWPREINRHYDQLHSDVNNWLDRYDSLLLMLGFTKALSWWYRHLIVIVHLATAQSSKHSKQWTWGILAPPGGHKPHMSAWGLPPSWWPGCVPCIIQDREYSNVALSVSCLLGMMVGSRLVG